MSTATVADRRPPQAPIQPTRYSAEELAKHQINVHAILRARRAPTGELLADTRLHNAHSRAQREFRDLPESVAAKVQRAEYELTLLRAIVRELAVALEAIVEPVHDVTPHQRASDEADDEPRPFYDPEHFDEMVQADRRAGLL